MRQRIASNLALAIGVFVIALAVIFALIQQG
jgi:hypothetical protein